MVKMDTFEESCYSYQSVFPAKVNPI